MRELSSEEEKRIGTEMKSGKGIRNEEMPMLDWRAATTEESLLVEKYKKCIMTTLGFVDGGIWMKFWIAFIFAICIGLTKGLVSRIIEDLSLLNVLVIFGGLFLLWLDFLMGYSFFCTFIQKRGDKFRKELKNNNYEVLDVTGVGYMESKSYNGETHSTSYHIYVCYDNKYICVPDPVGPYETEENVILLKFKIKPNSKKEIYDYSYVAIAY